MIIPVLCFHCGREISVKATVHYEMVTKRLEETKTNTIPAMTFTDPNQKNEFGDILDLLQIKRECCRKVLISTMEYRDYY
jgi:DNA-directed RNA polymerase subunit N (RpoN/RPB10)